MAMTDKPKLMPTKNLDQILAERVTGNREVSVKETPAEIVRDSEICFKPSKEMRMVKATFYTCIKGLGIDISALDVDVVARYVAHNSLYNWWAVPGFKEWFKNAEVHKYKVRMLVDKQLELLEEIQDNPDQAYSVKDILAAGKQILEYKKAFEDEEKDLQGKAADEETVKRIAARVLETKRLVEKRKELEDKFTNIELPS
jgi:hypothetical protein